MLLRNVFEQQEALKRDLIGKSPEEAKKIIQEARKRISLALDKFDNVPVQREIPITERNHSGKK